MSGSTNFNSYISILDFIIRYIKPIYIYIIIYAQKNLIVLKKLVQFRKKIKS